MDVANIKLEIIKLIGDLQNETILKWILQFLKKKPSTSTSKSIPPTDTEKELAELHKIAKEPIPESIDLEQLKIEQQYNPKALFSTLNNWDYKLFEEDSLEEMLNTLSK